MAKFDPLPKTPEWTDWNNGRIDHVIDLNDVAEIWFQEYFRGLRCIYLTYKDVFF